MEFRHVRSKFLTVGVLLVCGGAFAHWMRPDPPPPPDTHRFPLPELAALDWTVQQRFAVNPTSDFGMGPIGKRHDYFRPASKAEIAAVDNLQEAKQKVLFYVVGRAAGLNIWSYSSVSPVQGPVLMTRTGLQEVQDGRQSKRGETRFNSAGLEQDDTLTDRTMISLARRMFQNPDQASGFSDHKGPWRVDVVPILATNENCVNCHNSQLRWKKSGSMGTSWGRRDYVRVGDPLGAAIYAYRPDTQ